MARKHGVIKVEVWEPGTDFRALHKDAQRAYTMLISQPTINNLGMLDYTPERWVKYAVDDTRRALNRALRELTDTNFCIVDTRTRELLVRTFIRHDAIGEQPNLVKSAGRQFREVESADLRIILAKNYPWLVGQGPSPCGLTLEPLPEPLWKPLPEGLTEPLPEGVREGVRPRARRAPVTPSPSPTPVPEDCLRAEGARAPSRGSHGALPEDKQREVLRLLDAIGDHADETATNGHPPTIAVLNQLAHQVPVGSLAKVHESLRQKRPKPGNRAGYVVTALQAERDAKTA